MLIMKIGHSYKLQQHIPMLGFCSTSMLLSLNFMCVLTSSIDVRVVDNLTFLKVVEC